jgi:colanic acid/amylovoran biosynthesis protein
MKTHRIMITGIWFPNKGGDLMLHALLQHLKTKFPHSLPICGFPVKPHERTWFENHSILDFNSREEIDIVLDASGFCFGDQWSDDSVRTAVNHRLSKMNPQTKLILLPQALGPFRQKNIRENCLRLFRQAAMICSRDQISFEYINDIFSEVSSRYLFPDFTNTVKGISPKNYKIMINNAVAIIPNEKMLTKRSKTEGEHYLQIMIHLVKRFRSMMIPHYFLCHQENDISIVRSLESSLGALPLVQEQCSLRIKGILGISRFIFSSRYHGLINGFNQGIPCIGTSWSHKYKELFKDFKCTQFLLEDLLDIEKLDLLLDILLDPVQKQNLQEKIRHCASEITEKTHSMWDMIDKIIDGGVKR